MCAWEGGIRGHVQSRVIVTRARVLAYRGGACSVQLVHDDESVLLEDYEAIRKLEEQGECYALGLGWDVSGLRSVPTLSLRTLLVVLMCVLAPCVTHDCTGLFEFK